MEFIIGAILEVALVTMMLYSTVLLYRRQARTRAREDTLLFAGMLAVLLVYPLLLVPYVLPVTMEGWFLDLYDASYYFAAGTVLFLLIYAFRRVERSEATLEGEVREKSREMLRRVEEQSGALETLRRRHTAELIEGAQRITSSLRRDLRTPFRTMQAALYQLREDPEDSRLLLDTVEENLSSVEETIEELGRNTSFGKLKKTLADMNDLAKQALEETPVPAGVTVEQNLEGGFTALNLDAPKMKRVLQNIVENAFEAMPNGGRLRLSVAEEDDGVVVEVSDTGVGIAGGELDMIFKPFYTTKPGKVGLGLTYVKDIVEAHGGSVSVSSEKWKGTRFTVRLPRLKA